MRITYLFWLEVCESIAVSPPKADQHAGFSECKPYLSEEEIGTFFDRAIRNRIGIRLTAEQHLSLTFDSSEAAQERRRKKPVDSPYVGIVDTRCSVTKIVKNCGYLVENLCEGAYGKGGQAISDRLLILTDCLPSSSRSGHGRQQGRPLLIHPDAY